MELCPNKWDENLSYKNSHKGKNYISHSLGRFSGADERPFLRAFFIGVVSVIRSLNIIWWLTDVIWWLAWCDNTFLYGYLFSFHGYIRDYNTSYKDLLKKFSYKLLQIYHSCMQHVCISLIWNPFNTDSCHTRTLGDALGSFLILIFLKTNLAFKVTVKLSPHKNDIDFSNLSTGTFFQTIKVGCCLDTSRYALKAKFVDETLHIKCT